MASPRASFRLKQELIEEVLEVFPGEKSSHSYVKALEYAVRQKRSELSDNVVPPVRQIETKVSDTITITTPVRQPKVPVRQSVTEEDWTKDLMGELMNNNSVTLPAGLKDPRDIVVNDDPHDDSETV